MVGRVAVFWSPGCSKAVSEAISVLKKDSCLKAGLVFTVASGDLIKATASLYIGLTSPNAEMTQV